MAAPYFSQVLASQRSNGTLFNTFSTAKSIINSTEIVRIPGNYLQLGSKLRIRAFGGISTLVTTPGTITFQSMLSTTQAAATVIAFTTGALQMTNVATTLLPFELNIVLRVNAAGTGTSAALIGGGHIVGENLSLTTGAAGTVTHTTIMTPITAPANGTGFDSTIDQFLDFYAAFSINNAANGVQLYDYIVEQLN